MAQQLKILNIVGARPNLPKIGPLMREMGRHPQITPVLVHTGQHYDEKLSDIFFRQMGIPAPQVNLEVGSGFSRGKLCCGKTFRNHASNSITFRNDRQ